MRKIIKQLPKKNIQRSQTSRLTFALNANLCQEAESMLKSLWSQNDFTYRSLSDLIRESLTAYQNGALAIDFNERDKFAAKKEITIRFASFPDLLNFYYSLPRSQRTAIIEASLKAYLDDFL